MSSFVYPPPLCSPCIQDVRRKSTRADSNDVAKLASYPQDGPSWQFSAWKSNPLRLCMWRSFQIFPIVFHTQRQETYYDSQLFTYASGVFSTLSHSVCVSIDFLLCIQLLGKQYTNIMFRSSGFIYQCCYRKYAFLQYVICENKTWIVLNVSQTCQTLVNIQIRF